MNKLAPRNTSVATYKSGVRRSLPHAKIEQCVFEMKIFGQNNDVEPMEAMLIYEDSSMDDENAEEYMFQNGLSGINLPSNPALVTQELLTEKVDALLPRLDRIQSAIELRHDNFL